jgi:ABC-type multidrug transport system fused ATPase/permease subunit
MLVSFSSAFLITTLTCIFIVGQRTNFGPAQAGLALTYSFLIPYFLLWFGFLLQTVSSNLTALERILYFSPQNANTEDGLPQEPAWYLPSDPQPARAPGPDSPAGPVPFDKDHVALTVGQSWPRHGQITFTDVFLRYRAGMECSLRGVSLSIAAGEKIGILGRTGAGKSSLLVALFRLKPICGGSIVIDGLDITDLGLLTLRRGMAIVPQEPLVMRGQNLRVNLDPVSQYSNAELVAVLGKVGLDPVLLDDGQGVESLSAGQKQLVSLARALLQQARIVVCDEPTANVDMVTDSKLQAIIRKEFRNATVITIAHRLSTVLDNDRVVTHIHTHSLKPANSHARTHKYT